MSKYTTLNARMGQGGQERLAEGVNPIDRVGVIPSELNGTVVCLDEMVDGDGQDVTELARNLTLWRSSMYHAKTAFSTRAIEEIQNQHRSDMAELRRELRAVKSILRTLETRPAIAFGAGAARRMVVPIRQGAPTPSRLATLPRAPRTLAALWDVYQNGVNGSKPARDFTDRERGQVKSKYCRWLPFWKCMDRLIRGGNDVREAIRRIRTVYGYQHNLTDLLKLIRDHEKEGGHASLR